MSDFMDFEDDDDLELLAELVAEHPGFKELADLPPMPPRMTDKVPEAYDGGD